MMDFLSLIPVIGTAVDKLLGLIPDVNARAKASAEFNQALLNMIAAEGQGQRDINRVEAAHLSVFVAGWRPFIGWVCGSALAYQYVLRPFWLYFQPDAPVMGLDDSLWQLMFGMLGIGGLRTFEKVKGVTK